MRRFPPLLAIASVAVLPLAEPLHAQRAAPAAVDRGSMLIGGGASLSRSRTTAESDGGSGSESETTTTQISLLPSLLYFVAPRVAVGGSLELARSSSGSFSQTVAGAGPSARYYFAGESATALPYVGASMRFARVSFGVDEGSSPSPTTRWELEGVAGLTWLLSRQVGIVTEAFARRLSFSRTGFVGQRNDVTATEFGLRLGVAAFVPKGR